MLSGTKSCPVSYQTALAVVPSRSPFHRLYVALAACARREPLPDVDRYVNMTAGERQPVGAKLEAIGINAAVQGIVFQDSDLLLAGHSCLHFCGGVIVRLLEY
jgi:hypothetical protein